MCVSLKNYYVNKLCPSFFEDIPKKFSKMKKKKCRFYWSLDDRTINATLKLWPYGQSNEPSLLEAPLKVVSVMIGTIHCIVSKNKRKWELKYLGKITKIKLIWRVITRTAYRYLVWFYLPKISTVSWISSILSMLVVLALFT